VVSVVVHLPATVQSAASINEALRRPAGWLERHAGMQQRRLWAEEDPVSAAAGAARESLERAGVLPSEVAALLVTAEAPPMLAGLAAALHHRLELRPDAVALEVGGACTGFLAALYLGRLLLPHTGVVLVVAVEAPSRYLRVEPGPAGEAAALFGDAAAACLLCPTDQGGRVVRLNEVLLGSAGSEGHLLRVERAPAGRIELHMDGPALAGRAVRTMAEAVQSATQRHRLAVNDLQAVVAHGGNGRLPGLLARQLGLPPERIWSTTAETGNLGSVSLPAAWAAHQPLPPGAVVWTAVGAGLSWGVAVTGR
jgi:3-oxoacyl-[acyl-carrier-protein] synthase-3